MVSKICSNSNNLSGWENKSTPFPVSLGTLNLDVLQKTFEFLQSDELVSTLRSTRRCKEASIRVIRKRDFPLKLLEKTTEEAVDFAIKHQLKRVNLSNLEAMDKHVKKLVRGNNDIESLNLSDCVLITGKSLLEIAAKLPKLQFLNLSSCYFLIIEANALKVLAMKLPKLDIIPHGLLAVSGFYARPSIHS
ncbi:MAG: hypothetical protein WB791_00680 [Waddliaceae bacterium]